MSLILNGTTGVSGVDGTAATPALQGTDANTGVSFGTDTVTINTGGVARVTTDASGNVGLGVTPSAWSTTNRKVFQLGAGSGGTVHFAGSSINSIFSSNYYFDGTNSLYQNNGFSQFYGQLSDGSHRWYTAPSGTAGNAISFTQAMTLTANGNLAIGDTADIARFRVVSATGGGISIAQGTENFYGASSHRFFSDNYASERMRIDSSGNLLVGVTSGAGGVPPDAGFVLENNGNMKYRTNGDNAFCQFFNLSGSLIGGIATNGSTVSYNTTSDYRLKENVSPMQNALATVAQLKPCTYTWKVDGSAGQGFIAHELQAVVPDCVTGTKDAVDKDGKPQYQGVDTSFLVATLVSAIQELTARLEALENK